MTDQELAVWYNDGFDRLTTGAEIIFATVLGREIEFAGERF